MNNSKTPQVGDKVLIMNPAYVAGKFGIISGEEVLSDGQNSGRWLVEVASDDLVLSLSMNDFQVLE